MFFTGVAAKRPVKGYIMGGAINGALNAATRSLALEFAKLGCRVNTIAPGLCDTPLNDILHAHDKEERYRAMAARLPVGRIGHAEDCALGAIYLMANGYVTAAGAGHRRRPGGHGLRLAFWPLPHCAPREISREPRAGVSARGLLPSPPSGPL